MADLAAARAAALAAVAELEAEWTHTRPAVGAALRAIDPDDVAALAYAAADAAAATLAAPAPASSMGPDLSDPAWCYSHRAMERHDEPYLQCLECGHTYPTAEQLEQDFMTARAAGTFLPADQIFSCAHCAHDF